MASEFDQTAAQKREDVATFPPGAGAFPPLRPRPRHAGLTAREDKRSEPRVSGSGRVRIFYGPDLGRWWDSAMRDASTSGLKLEIPRSLILPDVLTVLDIANGVVNVVQVKWRKGDMLGCKVRSRHSLEEDDPSLGPLKETWKALR